MEHRKESRIQPRKAATIRVLGLRSGPILQVSVLDVSGSGMRLRSKLPLPCGSRVEIETGNSVSRGNVCRCEPEEVSYELGIQVSETRSGEALPSCKRY